MAKYSIGICDDEPVARSQLKDYIQVYFNNLEDSYDIYEYSSGEMLINQYHKPLDILLLDIQMEAMSGIAAAKEIRKTDENVCIIFITAIPEYAKDGYKVRAFRYLIKPISYIEFSVEFVEAMSEINKFKNKQIIVKNDSGLFVLDYSDIIFIEAKGRQVWIKTQKEEILSYNTLKSFEEQLDKAIFYRCHHGYIINFKYLENITTKNSIMMRSGAEIPLSKHRRKDFMTKVTSYLGELL